MINDKRTDQLLEDIKKLLILDLFRKGVQGKEIADILKVDPATISRLVSARQVKKSK